MQGTGCAPPALTALEAAVLLLTQRSSPVPEQGWGHSASSTSLSPATG